MDGTGSKWHFLGTFRFIAGGVQLLPHAHESSLSVSEGYQSGQPHSLCVWSCSLLIIILFIDAPVMVLAWWRPPKSKGNYCCWSMLDYNDDTTIMTKWWFWTNEDLCVLENAKGTVLTPNIWGGLVLMLPSHAVISYDGDSSLSLKLQNQREI